MGGFKIFASPGDAARSRPPLSTSSTWTANLQCSAIRTINSIVHFVKRSHQTTLILLPELFFHRSQTSGPLPPQIIQGVLNLFCSMDYFETLVRPTNLLSEKCTYLRFIEVNIFGVWRPQITALFTFVIH